MIPAWMLGIAGALLLAGAASADGDEHVLLDGRPIPEVRVRRELISMFGAEVLDDLQLRILIAQAIERIRAGGARPDLRALDAFGERPTDELIDAVFFPEDPNHWPDFARFGLDGVSDGLMLAGFRQRMIRLRAGDPSVRPLGQFEMPIVRGKIRGALTRVQDIRRCGALLPDDICLMVGPHRVRVAEVWPAVAAHITPSMRRAGLRWAAVTSVLGGELQRSGIGLDFAAWRDLWLDRYGDMVSTASGVALHELLRNGAPSVDAFRTYLWLLEGYRRSIRSRLDRAGITAWYEANRDLLPGAMGGKVNAEVILFSSWDFAAHAPRPGDAREQARRRAEKCHQRLVAGEDFGALLDELSEYEDIPLRSLLFGSKPNAILTHKGRFGEIGFTALAAVLGEIPFEALVGGRPLALRVFRELEPGVPQGPLPCNYGWALARVLARKAPEEAVDLKAETTLEVLRALMVEHLFLSWALETIGKAQIRIE